MALIKLRKWQLMLVKLLAIPILKKIQSIMATRAEATEDNEWDNILANGFGVVISFLESPEAFEET